MARASFVALLPLALLGCQPSPTIVVKTASGIDGDGLHVQGTATVRASPTLVILRLGCSYTERRPLDAKAKVEATSRKILQALQTAGVGASEIQTTQFALHSSVNPETQLTSWTCKNTFEVRVKDVASAGKVLEGALNAGATTVHEVEYTIEELEELRAKARDEACRIAKGKAAQFAKSLGAKLGKPTRVSESVPYGWDFSRNAVIQSALDGPRSPALSPEAVLSAGSVSVELTVNVTYAIE
ncbi:MAG: SIMPL domain-containing protein [Fimbriimonadaceae bacterium]|nr:SIMPL domain-containing protein [Fimbriimonadaceae bacterium]